ncbi:MAG TPA: DUF748 domain-containing protein [Cyclobacteriaceae bacterium]|nr:DUF748 domain-containing protein [Cyclobacteriaceae bacterium]HMV10973.1 DUF748 domain-containing protein [Cyclobacteriaceae bacterium]HMV91379.1 DUF748 domain-containing protein [Cyclobacteriaceae bacterium]HMX01862.1 DUF748 domain-containing protein [Cyclobacteriaceae bacterium]HMX50786.1 DUF748 domain-containing protein [Cyclobacteriaceae bacterium]
MGILLIIFIALCLTALMWIGMPVLIRMFINHKLNTSSKFIGSARQVKLELLRGQIVLYDVQLESIHDPLHAEESTFSLHVPVTIIKLSWRSLWHREIAASVNIKRLSAKIIHRPDPEISLDKLYHEIHSRIRTLICFNVSLTIEASEVSYCMDDELNTIMLRSVSCHIDNLTNNFTKVHQTTFRINSEVFEGTLHVTGTIDARAEKLTFASHILLDRARLPYLNPFLRKYMRFDVAAGLLDVCAEVQTDEGIVTGYLEPAISNVQVRGRDDFDKGFFNKVWEWGIALAIKGIGSGRQDKISIRIPIRGTVDTVHVSVGSMIPGIINKLFGRILPMFRLWPVAG